MRPSANGDQQRSLLDARPDERGGGQPVRLSWSSSPVTHAIGAAATVLAVIVLCVELAQSAGKAVVKETLDEELAAVARLAARRIDAAAHAELVTPEQQNDQLYCSVVTPLREMIGTTPEFKYMYTLRPTADGFQFVVDAADPVDGDNDGVIDQAMLGEPCESPDESMFRALESGAAAVSQVPYTDKWGTFISAFAPVHRADGSVECLVGVDSTATAYLLRLARIDRAAALALIVGGLTSIGIGLGVGLIQSNRRSTHAAMTASECLLREMGQAADIGGWSLEIGAQSPQWTEQTYRIHEVEPGTPITLDMAISFYAPEARTAIADAVQKGLATGEGWDLELPLITARGRSIWVRAIGRAEMRDGKPARLFGAFQDITERRRSDVQLARLAMVAERTTNAVVVTDAERCIVWVNDGFTRLTGYTLEEVVGRVPGDFLQCGASDPAAVAEMRDAVHAGRGCRVEIVNRGKTGALYTLDIEIQPIHDTAGKLTGFIAIETDISEQVALRNKLAAQAAFARGILSSLSAQIAVLDEQGNITDVNQAWSRFAVENAGCDRNDLCGVGTNYLKAIERAHRSGGDINLAMILEGVAGVISGAVATFEHTYPCHSHDRERWFTMRVVRLTGERPGAIVSHEDVTSLVRTTKSLEQSRQSLEAANRSLEEAQSMARMGNWAYDITTGAIRWSAQVFKLFGRSETDGPPSFDDMLRDYVPRSADLLVEAIRLATTEGKPYSLILRTSRGANGVRYVRGEGRVRRDGLGNIVELFGTVTDVTGEVEREAALREARAQAEAANASKSEFLANMSHEIRTPITAILGFADLLSTDGDISFRQRVEHIDTIRRNGEHLLAIINDILDISKIEAGKMTIETMEVRPIELVHDVLSLMNVKAKAKGLKLEGVFVTPTPASVSTDPVRLRQILMNLIGNAVKFTEIGGVTLRIGFDPAAGMMQFDVEDTGIGLTPEQSSRLFGAFVQADSSTTRRFGGTGLGLRISKRLAEMLGGDITLRSEPFKGSTFTLTIRTGPVHADTLISANDALAQVRADAPQQMSPTGDARPLEGIRILLAEDGPDNQRLISFHLRKAGADVRTVENGRFAVEALTVDGTVDGALLDPPPVDLLVTDMQMPEMDGYTATRMLRTKGFTRPIVALTAHAMSGDLERCLEAGCDAYSSKPIDRLKFIEICRQTCSTPGVRRAG